MQVTAEERRVQATAEERRARAVALGNDPYGADYRELLALLKDSAPAVRRAAASAIGKVVDHNASLKELVCDPLIRAAEHEGHPQVLQYMLKTLRKCASAINLLNLDVLRDLVRNDRLPAYVREAANDTLAEYETKKVESRSRKQHWCARCHRIVTEEESRAGLEKYGKAYCFHCYQEKLHEDAVFEVDVAAAKKLRTTDEVAVQSKGERRIGNWLAAKGIAYRYDERMIVAGGSRIRPDFYLPEFDLYIEYWGMDTPEYVANMQQKKILYQREKKKLISLSFRDFERLEAVLEEKLSRHIPRL